jgi:acylphosphatase
MNEPGFSRLHAIIKGDVQGVGFRFFVMHQTNSLSLTGWVRNVQYDKVEVLAEGSRVELEQLLKDLYVGPDSARIDEVREEWGDGSGKFTSFDVYPSI